MRFEKGVRKDEVMQKALKKFQGGGGLYRHRAGEGHRAAHCAQEIWHG